MTWVDMGWALFRNEWAKVPGIAQIAFQFNRESMLEKAKLGRIATHSPIAEARRLVTRIKQAKALENWNPSDLPEWLDEACYRREILPRIAKLTVKKIGMAIDVSHPYATLIKRGLKIPHPRYWLALAGLVAYRR